MQKQSLGPALFMAEPASDLLAAIVVKIIDEGTANVVVFDSDGNQTVEKDAVFTQHCAGCPTHYMPKAKPVEEVVEHPAKPVEEEHPAKHASHAKHESHAHHKHK